MKSLLSYAVVIVALIVFAGSARAVPTVIDFEAYVDTQNLNGVNLGGVTLTAPAGSVEVFDDRFGVSYHSATKAVANFSSGPFQDNPLIGTFDSPMGYISLWAGDEGGDDDSWSLEAFDAVVGGSSLGIVASGVWLGDPYRELTITAPGILRFEATFTGPSTAGIGFDDLAFEIPEPTSMALMAVGAAGLVAWGLGRRKRRAARTRSLS